MIIPTPQERLVILAVSYEATVDPRPGHTFYVFILFHYCLERVILIENGFF